MFEPADLRSLRDRLASDLEAGRFDRLHEYLGVSVDEASRIASDLSQIAFADPAVRASSPPATTATPGAGGESADFGPYRLGPELGRGGQGVVYRATDTRLGRTVALKLLTALAPQSPSALARFQREAQLTARLDDPCVCTVLDVGVRGSTPWMAMQFIDGETLAARIKRELDESGGEDASGMRRRPVGVWIRLVARLARTLHAAHELGIVHRDIKPGNVMLRGNDPEHPVLLDFGLAGGEDVALLTRSGDVMGTPAYMSPEQLSRGAAGTDRRSDVYALGVLLYECLTLRRPFRAPTLDRLYQDILSGEPTDPRRHNPQIGRDLAVVIATAMQRTRERRYQTALDLAEDLQRIADNRPILARPPGPWVRAIALVRRRPAAVLAVMLALLLIGTAGFLATNLPRWREDRAKAAETEARERQASFDARLRAAFRALRSGDQLEATAATLRALFAENPEDREARAGLALALCDLRRAAEAVPIVAAGPATPEFDRLRAIVHAEATADAVGTPPLQRSKVPVIDAWTSPFRAGFDAVGCHLMALLERREDARLDGFDDLRIELEFARHAVTLSPREPNLLHHLTWADTLAQHGDREQARTCQLALRELWPDDRDARRAAFRLSEVLGERYACRQGLTALLAEAPDDRAVRIELAGALCDHGLPGSALALLDALPDPDSTWMRGQALSMLGRPDEAVASLRQAVSLHPDDADALLRLGATLHSQGRPRAALEALERSLAIQPGRSHTWLIFWLAHRDAGTLHAEFERRFAALRTGELRNLEEVEHLLTVGAASGRLAACEELVERAIARWPRQPGPLKLRAEQRRLRGQVDAALADLDSAVRIEPDHFPSLLEAAELHDYEGRDETARVIRWRTLDSASPDLALIASLRAAYRARGEIDVFERRLAELRLDDTDADRVILERATILGELGRTDEALALLAPGPRDPGNGSAFLGTAVQLRNAVRPDPAVDLPKLVAALSSPEESAAALDGLFAALAQTLAASGDPELRRRTLESILAARPDHLPIRLELLGLLRAAGDDGGVTAVAHASLDAHRDADSLLALCGWLWQQGGIEPFEATANRVLSIDSRNREAFGHLADLTVARRDASILQRAVDAALAADPRNHVALSWQGWLALVTDDRDRAIARTRDSLEIEPSSQATANLARIVPADAAFEVLLDHAAPDMSMQSPALIEACLGERTGEFYATLARRSPHLGMAWQALADWQRRQGTPALALETLRQAGATMPHDAVFLCRFGEGAAGLGDDQLAEQLFAQARRAAPSDPIPAARHAGSLVRLGRRDAAERLARRIWLAHPGEPSVHDVLFPLLDGDHRDPAVRDALTRSLQRIETALDRAPEGIAWDTVVRHATARLCRTVLERFGTDAVARLDLATVALAACSAAPTDTIGFDGDPRLLPRFDGIVDALLDRGVSDLEALLAAAERAAPSPADRAASWLLGARAASGFAACRPVVDRLRAKLDDASAHSAARLAALAAYSPPPCHPLRATGAPSQVSQLNRANAAWMPLTPNGGEEWLEAAFAVADPPAGDRALRIHHAQSADGLAQITATLGDGRVVAIPFDAADFDPLSLVRTVALPADLGAAIAGVKLEFRTDLSPGWDGIDAVGVVAPSGDVRWADDARASSSSAWGLRPQS